MKPIALLLVVAVALLAGRAPAAEAQMTFPQADFSGYRTGTAVHADAGEAAGIGSTLTQGEFPFLAALVASQDCPGAVRKEMQQKGLTTASLQKKFAGWESEFRTGLGTSLPGEPDVNQVGAEAERLPRVEAAATPPAGGTLPKTGQGATCHAASTFISSA